MKKLIQTKLASALALQVMLLGAALPVTSVHAGVVVIARPVVVARPVTIATSPRVAAPVPKASTVTAKPGSAPKSATAPTVRPFVAVPVVVVPVQTTSSQDCSGKKKAECKK